MRIEAGQVWVSRVLDKSGMDRIQVVEAHPKHVIIVGVSGRTTSMDIDDFLCDFDLDTETMFYKSLSKL